VFLLVPAHPGSPGQRAVKSLLLLLLKLINYNHFLTSFISPFLPAVVHQIAITNFSTF